MTNIALLPAITGTASTSQDGDCDLAIGFQNSGAAIDLSGIAFSFYLHPFAANSLPDMTQVLLAASTSGNYLTNSGLIGIVSLSVPASVMARIPAGTYVGDLIASKDGETLVVGTITFNQTSLGPCLWATLTTTPRNAATANSVGYVPGPGWDQWKGNWSSDVSYVKNDVVFDGYSSWIAVQPNTGQAPSTSSSYWALVASGVDPTDLNNAVSAAAASASSAYSAATQAAAGANNAVGSATAAASSASAAAASESQAATSAANASGSASAAQTSATNAAASATAAASSASSASTSETNAANSATSAAASASSLDAALASFNALYLGKLANDPATDNNGNALVVGAEYFNTTENKLRVYTSSGWQDYDAAAQADASNAALSATNAASSASAASASATSAASSASAASTSETNAANSATAAATSESQASSHADDASTYAVNAQSSAQAAAQSATAAQDAAASVTQNGNIGYKNAIRNPAMDIVQRGTSGSVAAGANAYTLDGWIVAPTGAAAAWSQVYAANISGNALRIACAAGMTGLLVIQRIESTIATRLLSALNGPQTVTVQATISNQTGAAITPSVSAGYASARDNFGTVEADLAKTALQSIPAGATQTVALTFVPNAGLSAGYQLVFYFDNYLNASGGYVDISLVDLRATPGAASGLNNEPLAPEVRPIQVEHEICYRYLFVERANGVGFYIFGVGAADTAARAIARKDMPQIMRATPTFSFSNLADFTLVNGTLSGLSYYGNGLSGQIICASSEGLDVGGAYQLVDEGSGNASMTFSAEL